MLSFLSKNALAKFWWLVQRWCCIVCVLEQDKTNCQMTLWVNCILIRQCQGYKMVLQADINLCLRFTEWYFLYQAPLDASVQQNQREGSIGNLGFYLVCRMIHKRSYIVLVMAINMLVRAPFSVLGLPFKIGQRAISQSVYMCNRLSYRCNIVTYMHDPALYLCQGTNSQQVFSGWLQCVCNSKYELEPTIVIWGKIYMCIYGFLEYMI